MHQTKELEGDSQKKLNVPETSSERTLEHSEKVNSKNSFFCYSDVHTKNKKQSQPKTRQKFRSDTKFLQI